jgi:hypothetical protein
LFRDRNLDDGSAAGTLGSLSGKFIRRLEFLAAIDADEPDHYHYPSVKTYRLSDRFS